jgi:CCR4-NOT complex subunit CAF16
LIIFLFVMFQILDIDLAWRMHKASDGQRRRVQICMGLLKPFKVCFPFHHMD